MPTAQTAATLLPVGGGGTAKVRTKYFAARLPRGLPLALLAVLVVGGIVVGAVFSFAGYIEPDPLSVVEMPRQAHIQGALNPERLVPPPALPPSLFIGIDRPALESADRDWRKLDRQFAAKVLIVFERLRERGYEFALLEGYRSPERQDLLAGMGNHVTSAKAFQSKHQYGMAVDVAPLRDQRFIVSERDPWAMNAYLALGDEAARAGLDWGGRWWFKDYGHIELAAALPAPATLGR
jgi:peptidoglycan L-alanyl-D-glutamate endopeptidase CwlK